VWAAPTQRQPPHNKQNEAQTARKVKKGLPADQ
jgi:hypothetical protein